MPFILKSTITQTFLERVKLTPDIVGFQYKPMLPSGPAPTWRQVTFREFFEECRRVAHGLMELGVTPGKKVAILSNTRYEWSLCDMAILGCGAVTVPIYASNITDDVEYILNHSEAEVLILENPLQFNKVLDIKKSKTDALPFLKKLILIDAFAVSQGSSEAFLSLNQIKDQGRVIQAKNPGAFEKFLETAKPKDIITICYTSGTTGIPKGALLTHDNMMSVLEDCVESIGEFVTPDGEKTCSFLPYSHVLGKVESMAIHVFGWHQCYAEGIDRLLSNLIEVKPTILFSVPRIFEKAHSRIVAQIESGPVFKKKLFNQAFELGRAYYAKIWNKEKPSISEKIKYQLAQKVVFRQIAQRFGGKLRFSVCGGAPLPKEIGEFFQIVGIQILEGYGLTETCAPVAINTPADARYGSVGRPLPEVSVKIADDGEILLKSRKVFAGYYKMPEETKEVLESDGWFHSGDIGYVDAEGFVRITDRKKDIIVTSGGKNIAPQKIENLAKTQRYITQFVVIGDRKNYLTALVTLDKEDIQKYASEQHILYSQYSELIKNPKIHSLIQKAIDHINSHLANYESIKKFIILPDEFTIESGELTPSLKIKRKLVTKKYKTELESLYE